MISRLIRSCDSFICLTGPFICAYTYSIFLVEYSQILTMKMQHGLRALGILAQEYGKGPLVATHPRSDDFADFGGSH